MKAAFRAALFVCVETHVSIEGSRVTSAVYRLEYGVLLASPVHWNRLRHEVMDEATRNEVAECLERLADEAEWNPDLHKRCYNLAAANWDNELLKYIHDDLIHYSGVFHSRNIFGFRVKPNRHELEDYRHEFRSIAAALRAGLSLVDAKKQFGL
jgi:hypothetical protein